jgi:hypothetical protein
MPRIRKEVSKKNDQPAGRFSWEIILENTVSSGFEGAKKNPFGF